MCERIRAQVSVGLDEDASQLERAMIASHLDRCPDCAEYAIGVRTVTDALRSAPLEPMPKPVTVHRARRPVRAHVQGRLHAAAAVATALVVGVFAGTQLSGTQSLPADSSFVPEGSSRIQPPPLKQLQIEQALLDRAEPGNPVDLSGRVL